MASVTWQNGDWVSYDTYAGSYPVPKISQLVSRFDTSQVYTTWKFDTDSNNYLRQKGYPLQKLGTFAYTTNITTMTIPLSVYKLGPYAFFESNLESATIVPDCMYYNTTFPVGCALSYYTVSSFIVNYTGKTVYGVNENFDMSALSMSMTSTDGTNVVTRSPYAGYSISGFDSSTTGYKNVSVVFAGTSYALPDPILVAPYNNQYVIIMNITALKTNSISHIQMAELNFYTGDTKIDLSGSTITATSPGVSTAEEVTSLIDNNVNTKYCAPWPSTRTVTITISTSVDMSNITDFSYTTGDDTPGRDPVTFTLQYSENYGVSFSDILTVSGASITSNRKTETQKWQLNMPN